MELQDYDLILASGSPRRKELLEMAGLEFELRPLDMDESYNGIPIDEVAEMLSQRKAGALELHGNEIAIAADTVVIIDEEILGKPVDESEAIEMILKLSAKSHRVMTGVCIRSEKKMVSFSETTHVDFRKLELEEIQYYVETFKPLDKAGAYGIQEWIGIVGVEKIEGDYFNVVGLPVQSLYLALKEFIHD